VNPDPRKAIARHEILITMEDILNAARTLLRKRGKLALIFPSVRLFDVLLQTKRFDLEPKRVQIHYPSLHASSKLTLMEAVLGGKPGLEILPPLIGQGAV